MQVTETLSAGLKREFKVVVDAAELDRELNAKLNELSAKANIRGFRPGKVPVSHLKRVYGKSVMAEVVQKAIDDKSKSVPAEMNLKPAYRPEVKLPEDKAEVNAVIDGKGDLAFSLAFEVIPAFELLDHSGLELTRHIVEVTDAHIEEALKRMAANSREFEAKAEGALAETGDRLTIDFAGTVEGRAFDGGNAKDVAVELGAGRMLAGFEDQLLGASAGEVRTVTVTFPENYGVKELAGKPAEFAVTVSRIEVAKEPAIDDDFAERRGFEDLSGLKEALRRRIAREFDQMTAMKLKRDVLDALDKQYRFDLPEKLVEGEFDAIWRALVAEMQRAGKSFADEATNEEDARREYRAIAERRVRLGLVLGTLGEKEGVTVSEQELQQALYERVRQFPGQERRIFEHYRKNPGALIELRGPIFERKVVDLIVSQGKVADRPVAREELQAMVEDEEEQAAAIPAPAAAEAHDHDDRDHDHSHEHGHHHHDHAHDHAHAPDRGQPHGTTPKPHRTAPASG